MRSLSQTIHSINRSTYKLDTSGVTGILGGDNAIDALATIHLYAGRNWAGWYNYPGTVSVARKFGQMAKHPVWDSIFPGPNESPAITFSIAGKTGPEYSGSFSGTKLGTRYPGYLIAKQCAQSPRKPLQLFKKDGSKARETKSSATVTLVSLPRSGHREELITISPKSKPRLAFWAIVPSAVSILACVLCFLGEDPLCASLILLGVICSGISSLILGTATLKIHVPVPSDASPPGDGLMSLGDGSVIVLKGEEADVNMVTKGVFELNYPAWIWWNEKYHMIGITSSLLYVQFLVQLLFTPRCTFFGQILFLISFVASGVYHLYVASHEKEKVHRELLSQVLSVRMGTWKLGTRTQMAVLVCLVLGDGRQDPLKSKPDVVLTRILPNVNETEVWKYWKKKVLKELEHFWDPEASHPYEPAIQVEPDDKTETADYADFSSQDIKLLKDLIDDAWCVFDGYRRWRDGESEVWQEHGDGAEEKEDFRLVGGSPA